MKLHIQAFHTTGSILADESGCEVARTSTEGCDTKGCPYVDAPDLAQTIAHRVNCHDELVAALELAVSGLHRKPGPMGNAFGNPFPNQYAEPWAMQAIAALERAKQ